MWHRLKGIGVAVLVASLTTLAGTGSASATALEVGGTTKTEAVAITASLMPGTTLALATTSRGILATCKKSVVGGTTSTFIGARVTGALNELAFEECTHEPVTVEESGLGQLFVEHIAGTTNGTVFAENQKVTVPTAWPGTTHVTCTTGEGTHIGTLTGATTAGNPSANAIIDIKAVLNCGFLLPSAIWEGGYVVTTPTELGVVAPPPPPPPTTLEVAGTTKNEAVAITASIEPGTTLFLGNTSKSLSNTCKKGIAGGTTSVFTGEKVTGALNELTFEECTHNPVTVEEGGLGQLYVKHIAGTTNGSVFAENQKVTVPTSLSGTAHVTCSTSSGTPIGTLTGKASGHSTIDIKAVLNCGFLLPSALWEGSYVVTSPTGLGVVE